MSNIPIVFIHQGDSSYLYFTLRQSRKNGNSNLILIGDESNNKYPFVTEHLKIQDFNKSANQFAKVYKHLSINPYGYTLFSTQRWFILKDFMLKRNIPQCFYQDSDNMLYMNVAETQKKFNQYGFAMFPSGHMGFINSLPLLEEFCEFTLKYYSDPHLFNELNECYRQGEHIHDQKLFELFYEQSKHPLKDFTKMEIFDNSTFDNNINCGSGYEEIFEKRKKVYAINNKVYCRHTHSDRLVEFLTLQFQGPIAKNFIEYFSQETIQQIEQPAYFDYATCKWIIIRKNRLAEKRTMNDKSSKNMGRHRRNANIRFRKRRPSQNRRTIGRRNRIRDINALKRKQRILNRAQRNAIRRKKIRLRNRSLRNRRIRIQSKNSSAIIRSRIWHNNQNFHQILRKSM